MTKSMGPEADVPFRHTKKQVVYDLMRGGAGTPWENRGEHGPVGGFIKSAVRALFKPNLLFDHIRSTTVTSDAQTFLWICAACWGVGVAVLKAVHYFRIDASKVAIDTNSYLIASVIETATGVGWAYLMFRLIVGLYHKLVITEIKQAVPATLTFNVASYAMGPSLFAPIPLVGPLIAVVGAFVSLVAAGRKRLFVSWRAAIIDALLPFGVALVATVVLYFVLGFAIDYALSPESDIAPADTVPQQFAPPTTPVPTTPPPGYPQPGTPPVAPARPK